MPSPDPPPLLTHQPIPFQLRIRRGAKGRWFIVESLDCARRSARMLGGLMIGMAVLALILFANAVLWDRQQILATAMLLGLCGVGVLGFRRVSSSARFGRVTQFIPSKSIIRIGYITNAREDPGRTRTFGMEGAAIRLCPLRVHTLKDWHNWGVVPCVEDERVILAADTSRASLHAYMDGLPKPLKKLVAPGEGPELTGAGDIRIL
jgi:hypothetical protein